jgi:preprotein translocase subunit YajC
VLYGLAVLALAMFFTLTGNIFSVFILLPLAVMFWFYFVRPAHRRRYRKAIADLPKWELRPQ